jgi:hypothetical protein
MSTHPSRQVAGARGRIVVTINGDSVGAVEAADKDGQALGGVIIPSVHGRVGSISAQDNREAIVQAPHLSKAMSVKRELTTVVTGHLFEGKSIVPGSVLREH